MLIELSIRQSSLRRKPALVIAILVIDDLDQRLIAGINRLLHLRVSFFSLRTERVDCVSKLAGVNFFWTRIDGISEVFVVDVHLCCVVDRAERYGIIRCQMVRH